MPGQRRSKGALGVGICLLAFALTVFFYGSRGVPADPGLPGSLPGEAENLLDRGVSPNQEIDAPRTDVEVHDELIRMLVVAQSPEGRPVEGVRVMISPVQSRQDVDLPDAAKIEIGPGATLAQAGLTAVEFCTAEYLDLPEKGDSHNRRVIEQRTRPDGTAEFTLDSSFPDYFSLNAQLADHVIVGSGRTFASIPARVELVVAPTASEYQLRVSGPEGALESLVYSINRIPRGPFFYNRLHTQKLGRSDASGLVSITLPSRAGQGDGVVVSSPGMLSKRLSWTEMVPGGTTEVVLESGFGWRMQLLDASGSPIGGVRVMAMQQVHDIPEWRIHYMPPVAAAVRYGLKSEQLVTNNEGWVEFSGWGTGPVTVEVAGATAKYLPLHGDSCQIVQLGVRIPGQPIKALLLNPHPEAEFKAWYESKPLPFVSVEGEISASVRSARAVIVRFRWTDDFQPIELSRVDSKRRFKIHHIVMDSCPDSFTLDWRIDGGPWSSLGVISYQPGMELHGLKIGN